MPDSTKGHLGQRGDLSISRETIHRYVWADRAEGGALHRHRHLRCAPKKRCKRHRRYDSRGRLAGKRAISERPATVE